MLKKNFIIFPSCESGTRNGDVLFRKWKSKYPSISINISVNVFLSTILDGIHVIAAMPPALHLTLPLADGSDFIAPWKLSLSFTCPNSSWLATSCWQPFPSPSVKFSWEALNIYLAMWYCICWDDSIYACWGLLIWQKPNPIKAKLCFYINKWWQHLKQNPPTPDGNEGTRVNHFVWNDGEHWAPAYGTTLIW